MARVNSSESLTPTLNFAKTSTQVTTKTGAFQNRRKIELFIECTDLTQLDKFSTSDPLCVLLVKKLGHWTEYGRSESIPNNLNPRFVETFIIEPCSALYPRLRFSLYDLANFTSKDLRKHNFIGCVEFDFETLLASEPPFVRTLRIPGDIKTRGYIKIYHEDVTTSTTNVRLQISGMNLEKKGLLSKWDAFFEVGRLLPDGHFHPVYRSEIVTRTLNPKWAPFDIQLQKLCNEDISRETELSCWHFSNSHTHTLIGQTRCTVDNVLKRTVKLLNLVKPQKQPKQGKNTRRLTNSGELRIVHCQVDRQFSLVDFVRGGCEIRMVCALDFTLSNGEPTSPSSLHSLEHENNEYIRTIEALGPILTYYDEEKRIPTFGFGAKNKRDPYCFALNGNDNNPDIQGIENLVDTYLDALSNIGLGGPTYLAPVINRIAEYAKREVSQGSQYYVVALVIMDGVANDIDDTVDQIVSIYALPLSIIIAGVGPADFKTMDDLFNSRRKSLRSRDHKELSRQNTCFIALRRHSRDHEMQLSAARETLANISRQIIAFFTSKGIEPNPPLKGHVKAAWDEPRGMINGIELTARPSSPRMRTITPTQNPRCPTCGSLIENNNISST